MLSGAREGFEPLYAGSDSDRKEFEVFDIWKLKEDPRVKLAFPKRAAFFPSNPVKTETVSVITVVFGPLAGSGL
jgi:hypothetical protein